MRRWPYFGAALVAAAAGCGLLGQWLWSEPQPSPSARIGVINLTRMWEGYQKRLYLDSKLTRFRETKTQVLEEKKNEITQLTRKLDLLAPGSTQREAVAQELEEKQIQARTLVELSTKEVARRYFEYWDIVYNDIRAAADRIAPQEGYDLVLKAVDVRSRTTSAQELQGKIEGMTVLYAAPHLDLTEKVLTMLNQEFARSAEGKSLDADEEQAP